MKLVRWSLIITLCGATICANASTADCDNPIYRRQHPITCTKVSAGTILALGGVLAATSGAIAMLGTSGGSAGGATHSATTYMPTLPTYTHVGADVDSARLTSIMTSGEYNRNFDQYNDIRLAYATARGYTGAGTTIAVLDTGSDHWHGRAVAEIAHGPIARNATIESYKIANGVSEFMSYRAIGDTIASAHNANIINNSWNATKRADTINSRAHIAAITDDHFIQSISDAAARDTIFVWAAGNEGASQSGAFSALPRVMPELRGRFVNVVAWDSATGALADYSNACGVTKDYCITAPGSEISAGHNVLSGTSFAAPVVSAAIAVIREAFPYMNATEITTLLFTTARDLGEPGVDDIYGWGMLDLERATRPVGTELVPLADGMMHPLRAAHVPGTIAQKIQSADLKFAYFDSFGRAFESDFSENIKIKNRSLALDRLRDPDRISVSMRHVEIGFGRSDFIATDGILKTDGQNTVAFAAWNSEAQIMGATLFQRTQIGISNPRPTPESMIDHFSSIYTASATLGARRGPWSFTISTPDTIIGGNMMLRLPTGRRADGAITFNDYDIDLASRPAIEYAVTYGAISAVFVDNPYGTDEVYVIAKTKLSF